MSLTFTSPLDVPVRPMDTKGLTRAENRGRQKEDKSFDAGYLKIAYWLVIMHLPPAPSSELVCRLTVCHLKQGCGVGIGILRVLGVGVGIFDPTPTPKVQLN